MTRVISLFGVTTLDVVRASKFVSSLKNAKPEDCRITVIGGHSGPTIVPLFSHNAVSKTITGEEYKQLVNRVQYGGDEVVKAKSGTGSATLSMAFAGARFTSSLLEATVNKSKNVVEPAFVYSDVMKAQGIDYFATNVTLGVVIVVFAWLLILRYWLWSIWPQQPEGVEKIHQIGNLSASEQELLNACVPELKKNIQKGVEFANKK